MKHQLLVIITLCLLFSVPCFGQKADSTAPAPPTVAPKLKIGGYVDAYYAYYSDSVGTGKPQKFPAISPISNTFGINIAQVTTQFTSDRVRSTITLHAGDLPSAAWSPVYNYIQEANAGVRLCKNLWVDAGFFKTHIGTEALLPKDNICSSVSVITFYEPWWQSGARLTYTPSDKFTGALYVVNGYNEFIATNKKKAAGLALSYNLSDEFNIAYNNFLSDGTVDSVSTSHWRLLNNLVFNLSLGKKVKVVLGADYIVQQNSGMPLSFEQIDYNYSSAVSGKAVAYSFIGALKYQMATKWAIYGRFETFNDHQGFLSPQINVGLNSYSGYQLTGGTLGLEYKPIENSYIRLEGRDINMRQGEEIFYTNGGYVGYRIEIMLNLGVSF